ncbi:lipid-A-disaccharide synthase N-terminal domain-containing protein [Mesonia sp. MT50]|uniref:Lipid-A-disaccharide synthase N-terminal domain-containing protein n=1 Tax=Mesonia profundi TaxID=3070998 RepID=A0ABU1A4Q3_9FLAO|nr:lipid-A-disaccharide synthase N-terminal domain-containing protein [Mesonia profundi]MDQ7917923.1 lipid-A-disaccharide synthase N-terminal domain-containing protein [Mesonia profundi]
MQDWIIYTIGFTAQILFASRIIIQWFKSEKANKIKTPVIFWKLSLLGAIMFFIYGYLRRDFSIMLGQAIIYFVFIRNLALQKEWKPSPFIFKFIVIGFPIFAIWYGIFGADINYNLLFSQQEDQGIGTWLLITGIVGQLVYVFRFIYQWIYSEQKQKSSLPLGFWILSLVGSAIVLVYAIYREDPVLLASHFGGSIIYIRNVYIGLRSSASS